MRELLGIFTASELLGSGYSIADANDPQLSKTYEVHSILYVVLEYEVGIAKKPRAYAQRIKTKMVRINLAPMKMYMSVALENKTDYTKVPVPNKSSAQVLIPRASWQSSSTSE